MNPTARGAGSTSSVGKAIDSRADLLIPIALAAGVVGVGFVALLIWDAWFVNHDGTFYTALAHNLRHGAGYTFPDGSTATFRGPGYAGLLAAGWLVLEDTARSAIWVSRVAGLLVPAALTLLLWRWTAAWWVALSVGAVAAVQPWSLVSGAQFFAPDGLGAGLALLVILIAFWWPSDLPGDGRLRTAGVVVGLAYVVKDPFLLVALVPVGVLAAHRDAGIRSAVSGAGLMGQGWLVVAAPWLLYSLVAGGRLPDGWGGLEGAWGWAVLIALVAIPVLIPKVTGRGGPVVPVWLVVLTAFTLALLAYVAVTATDLRGVDVLWSAIRADLQTQLYRDSTWGLLLPAFALALFWSVTRFRSITVQAATLLGVIGLAGLVFASLSGSGMRNALLLAYGLLLLVGLAVSGLATWRGWTVVPALALLGLAFVGSVQASSATNERLPVESLTAEAPATRAAAEWLREAASGRQVVGTPLFTQSMWRLAGGTDPWRLFPNHVMDSSRWEAGDREFDRRVAWAGTEAVTPTAETGLSYTVNRSRTGSYLPQTVTEALQDADFVVITGNAGFPGSAFDAGGLLPTLETSPAVTPVWRSPADADQWVVIYEVVAPAAVAVAPPLIHVATDTGLPVIAGDQVVLDSAEYQSMVRDILAWPSRP